MRFASMAFSTLWVLALVEAMSAQVAPGTHIYTGRGDELVVLDVSEQGVFERGCYPVDTSMMSMPQLPIVEPTSGDILVLTGPNDPPYDNVVARLRWSGTGYKPEAMFSLATIDIIRQGGISTLVFDDEGILYFGDGGLKVAIDLERQSWTEVPFQQQGSLMHFVPPKGRRPRVELITYLPGPLDFCDELSVVDPQGRFLHLLRQFCGNVFTNPRQGSIFNLETTRCGRTFFIGDFLYAPSGGLCLCLKEVVWNSMVPFVRDVDFGEIRVGGYAIANGLGKVYVPIARNLIPQYGMATLDLRTGAKSVVINPAMRAIGVLSHPSGNWFPQNVLTVFPSRPTAGTPFTARMSMGGEIGDLGIIVAESAVIGGTVHHLQIPVVWGTMDDMGLVKTRLPYDPVLQPMSPGDSLTFRGYRFDGTEVIASEPWTVTWQ